MLDQSAPRAELPRDAPKVNIDKAKGNLDPANADKVLFYVGGVALLTLAINATTCPFLVKRLGITNTPEDKVKLIKMLHGQLKFRMNCGTERGQVRLGRMSPGSD